MGLGVSQHHIECVYLHIKYGSMNSISTLTCHYNKSACLVLVLLVVEGENEQIAPIDVWFMFCDVLTVISCYLFIDSLAYSVHKEIHAITTTIDIDTHTNKKNVNILLQLKH